MTTTNFAKINKITNEVISVERASYEWVENWQKENENSEFEYIRTYYQTVGKNFAGIDYVYNREKDNFHPKQPYPSWTLSDDCVWISPKPEPISPLRYEWNENEQEWEEIIYTNNEEII
jgi:hypothetical protein